MSADGPSDIEGVVAHPEEWAAGYVDAGHWRNRTLHGLLDDRAAERGDAPYLLGPDGTVSYRELAGRSARIAAYLLGELGLAPHDRVAVQLTNRVEFVELLFGCSRAGVIPVLLLPRHRGAEARHVVELADAKAYVTLGGTPDARHDFPGMVDDMGQSAPTARIAVTDGGGPPGPGWTDYGTLVSTDWTARHGARVDAVAVNPLDPALFVLSGGTTGLPKAIPRTHNDYAYEWRRVAAGLGTTREWTTLSCVPIGHNASLVVVLGPTTVAGATMALEPTLKPEPLLTRAEGAEVSYLFAIPTQLVDFHDHPAVDAYDLSPLRGVMSGGQTVRPAQVYETVERWGVEFYNNFGMGEGPVTFTRPDDPLEVQATTVGRPLDPAADRFRILDPETGEELPDGTPGELVARGPGVFAGYFRNESANREAFDDGWFHTGDLLARRPDGNFEVYGRLEDTIIRGGENIHAPGVEAALAEHPAVGDVAVVGMPDERLGERPCAFVELAAGHEALALAELTAFMAERGTAVFKRPERLETVDRLPRTEVGKIDKAELEDRLAEAVGAEGER